MTTHISMSYIHGVYAVIKIDSVIYAIMTKYDLVKKGIFRWIFSYSIRTNTYYLLSIHK